MTKFILSDVYRLPKLWKVSAKFVSFSSFLHGKGDMQRGKSLENERFPKTGEIKEIRFKKTGHRRAKEAPYRRIGAYTKGIAQYKRERNRRRQVRLLSKKGLTQKQIAIQLGVSTRTINRDCHRIQRYVKGQFNKEMRKIDEARQEEFDRRYQGLTIRQELKLLKKDMKKISKAGWPTTVFFSLKKPTSHSQDYLAHHNRPIFLFLSRFLSKQTMS